MKVSPSGYYAWRKRLSQPPCLRRKKLADLIKDCYWENRKRYGTRRISAALQKSGIKVGRSVIRKMMQEEGLKAMQPKSFQPKTTDSRGTKASPNLLAGIKLEECAAGKVIIGDITYLPLANGKFCYLAVWPGQSDEKNHRLECGGYNDGRISHFSFGKGDSQRIGQSWSDHSFGSGKPICSNGFSCIVANKLFSPKYEWKRQLLR